METMSIKLILLIILGTAVAALVILLVFQRKRKRISHRSNYIDALYALIEGRRDDALRLLTLAVKEGESDVDAYLQLGNLLRDNNHPEKALQIHKGLTVRRDLGYTQEKAIQLALAEDLASLGKVEKSIQALEILYNKRKDDDVVLKLHTLYHRNGDFDRAFSILKELSRLRKDITRSEQAAYLATASYSLYKQGRRDEAERHLDKALKEDRNSPAALYLAGKFAMEEQELGKAAKMWEKLLDTYIEYFEEVIPSLEKVLYQSGKFQDLERILNELILKYPGRPSLVGALASFYEKKGELEKAVAVMEDERSTIGTDFTVYIRLASLYLLSGDTTEARNVLEDIDLASKQPVSYRCLKCGNRTDAPLAYCSHCSSFNSYTRDHEKNA